MFPRLDALVLEHPTATGQRDNTDIDETHRESTRTSSPSTPTTACGVLASMTCSDDHQRTHVRTICTYIVIVAVRAVLVALLVVGHVLAKRLFALFACKRHLRRLSQLVVLRFCMALCTVEPLLAARRAYRNLCVQDVFTASV